MKSTKDELAGTAYSYIRFSAKEQERGDSLRRQTELRDAWLVRHPRVKLDTTLTLRDLGVSAYRGLHRDSDRHKLGEFLGLVKSGQIPNGSLLIIENLDRLSREEEEDAVSVFLSLITAGIVIVQLEPETVFKRGDGMLGIIRAVIELSRAHAESARKSVRVAEAWDAKKRAAVKEGKVLTGRCPAWLELSGGKFRIRPGADAVIRRLFDMARSGHGCRAIAATLNRDKVPGWGKGRWEEAYVRKILMGRSVLGEYQPMKGRGGRGGKRVADPAVGPVTGYYPAVVTEQEWLEAAAARKARDNRGGRPAKQAEHVNVFQGLLHDGISGKPVQIAGRMYRGEQYRVLVPSGNRRHGDPAESFPLKAFEQAVLSLMAEIDPQELLPRQDASRDAVGELEKRLGGLDARRKAVQAKLVDGDEDVGPIMAVLRDIDAKCKATADELATARLTVATPLGESWADCKGIIGTLATARDERDLRVRLRSLLVRLVTGIWVAFDHRGQDRLAAVRVYFAGGQAWRDYQVMSRPARAVGKVVQPARWWVRSFRHFTKKGVPATPTGAMDMRSRKGAEYMRDRLIGFDPTEDEEKLADTFTLTGTVPAGPDGGGAFAALKRRGRYGNPMPLGDRKGRVG